MAEKNRQKDRSFDRNFDSLSRSFWPFRETWLLAIVGLFAILDFLSTYVVLELIRKPHIVESGPLAGWALRSGGFGLLLLVDIASIGILSLVAFAARYLFQRFGFKGYGRAAFMVVLVPYIVRLVIVIINNVALGFR